MWKLVSLLCMVALVIILLPSAEARIRHYKWEIKYEYKSPDCFQKLVISINGETPGPTIHAHQGDTVIVELTNSLATENTAIHWHGIRQHGTPWFDGTEGVTQCPILPGETFKYKFVVDRPGTYLYHSLYGLQRDDGLYGSIQVALPNGRSEPYAYDYDRSIILGDWYHKSSQEDATSLSSINYVWVGEPQSLLIQGKGKFSCSGLGAQVCNASNPDCSYFTMTMVSGKTYRLRLSSMSSLASLSFQIQGHAMTVVEKDGHNVEPFTVQNLYIFCGETYSVLIKADQDSSRSYWMTTDVVDKLSTTPQGLAILVYYPNNPKTTPPPTNPPAGPAWNDTPARFEQSLRIKARSGYIVKPPRTSDKLIVLLNTRNTVEGYSRWSVNNVSLNLPRTPYLIAMKRKLTKEFSQVQPPEGYDYANYDIFSAQANINGTTSNAVYRLPFNKTVDIILQNANGLFPNSSDTHPWHLHGHDFWVLGYGRGKFDRFNDYKKYNLKDPVMMNTVPVHPYGWTALRFRTENPGVWLFHSQTGPRFFMGLGLVLEYGIDRVGRLPSSIMGCGATKGN